MDTLRTTTPTWVLTNLSKKLSLAGCYCRTLLYNVSMNNLQPTYSRLWREQHNLKFEVFFKSEWDTPVKALIVRNSYDDQSFASVDVWGDKGWLRVITVGLDVLEGVKSLSYLSVPENETKIDYEEKYTTAFATFYEEAKELSKLALHIVRPHDTIKV